MIDFYFFPTPNTWKVAIMLEECGLEYQVHFVDILNGQQFLPEFLALSPNNKVPAIVDHAAAWGRQAVFESGAILQYLAEKCGLLLAKEGPERIATLQWLNWQMGGLGPMAGQAHYFGYSASESIPFAKDRYQTECKRLYGVLDRQLSECQFVAGDQYSIADIACWPWVWFHQMHGQILADYPSIERWFHNLGQRAAVLRGRSVGRDLVSESMQKIITGDYFQA